MLCAVFTWTTTAARQKTKDGNENLQRASWYLFQIKRSIYTVCTKSASKDSPNCFAIFGCSACQGQHVFPDM